MRSLREKPPLLGTRYTAQIHDGTIELTEVSGNLTTTTFYLESILGNRKLENMVGNDDGMPNLLHMPPDKIKVEKEMPDGSTCTVISKYVDGDLDGIPEETVVFPS